MHSFMSPTCVSFANWSHPACKTKRQQEKRAKRGGGGEPEKGPHRTTGQWGKSDRGLGQCKRYLERKINNSDGSKKPTRIRKWGTDANENFYCSRTRGIDFSRAQLWTERAGKVAGCAHLTTPETFSWNNSENSHMRTCQLHTGSAEPERTPAR